MREDRFIRENLETWQKLEQTMEKLGSKGLRRFEKDELDNFISMYNRTCGHLSYCQTYFGNTATTNYLNRLLAAAHSYIYTSRSSNLKKFLMFFRRDFPLLIRQNIRFLLISTLIFLAGLLISFIYTIINPDNALAFLPRQYIENVNFGDSPSAWNGAIMSSFILTNNIKVGLTAFALGTTLGIGTVYTLVYNSFMLGSLAALAYQNGADIKFWALILPHGILELTAIFICGAAGLIIGYSIINPGIYSRKDSFIINSKKSIKLVCGTIPIFVTAGFIEGFFTPSSAPEAVKLIFALATLLLMAAYVIVPNIRQRRKNHS